VKSEEAQKQIILVVDGQAKAFRQLRHGLESGDHSPCGVERSDAAHFGHVPLHPEVIALFPLLKMLGDVMDRVRRDKHFLDAIPDRRRKGSGAIVARSCRLKAGAHPSSSYVRNAWRH